MKLDSKGAVRLASGAFAAALMCGAASGAFAQTATQADITALKAQIQALTDQVNALSAANDTNVINISALQTPTQGVTTATLPNGKPAFVTGDKRFSANIRSVVMFDYAHYDQDQLAPANDARRTSQSAAFDPRASDLNDGTNFRRARFGIDGKLFNDFDYSLIYELGGSGAEDAGHIQEAWFQFSAWKPFSGKVATRFKIGAFEPIAGLAASTSTSGMPIMERPAPAEIARNIAAGDSRSAFQITANGDLGSDSTIGARWLASGATTGNTLNTLNTQGGFATQPFDEQLGYVARATIAPFSNAGWLVHAGVNYEYAATPNDTTGTGANGSYGVQLRDRPELRVDGTRFIDAGNIDSKNARAVGLELAAQYKNFLIEGESFKYKINRRNPAANVTNPEFEGYYVQGSWVLTGEPRAYDTASAVFAAPRPVNNFAYGGQGAIGAWELALRYSDTDLNYHLGSPTVADQVHGGEQKITTIGLNWFPNPTIKFMLDFQDVKINRTANFTAAATATSPAFVNGTQIGQSYNAIAFRSQFSF